MDVSDASYYTSIGMKKNKDSQMGHTKKIFKKETDNITLVITLTD
jgi:hypothetical protein